MMNLLKKIAIAILVVFLVAGASIFVLSRFVPERDFIKSAIEKKLNAATNRQVSIGSVKIEFGFPSLLNVVVKNISITDHSKRELFSAAGLRLKVGLWSLMTGGLSLDDLKISSARLVIYRDASGNTESVFPKKTAGVEEQGPPSESESGSSGVTRKSPPTGAPQANKLSKAAGRNEFSWPIKQIEIESSQVVFEVSSVGLGKPVRLAFEKISGHITRDQNSLDFTVVGTPNFPGLESSELKTKGFVKVGPGFSFIESANINTTLDTARLVNPWFLPQETCAWFDKLRVNNLTLHTLMQRGSPPQIDFSARMFQTDGSAGLRFRVSGTLAPDFSHIEGLRINGSSDDVPISGVSGFVPKQVLHQFAPDGSVNLSFEGSWTQAGWSVIGSAGFNNFSTPAKYAFVGKKLAAALSFEVTPNSFLIKDLKLQNGARSKLLFMKGSINNPFSNTRSLDFNARLNLEGSWFKKLGINVPKDFNLGGPVPTHAHLTGPLKELKLDLNGDLSGSSLALKSVFEKEIGVKAEFKASTVISMDLTKSLNELFKHIDIKFSVGNATINLVSGFASISGCPIKLDAEILSSGEWLDLKNLSLKIDLPGNKRSLIFTKGYIKRFNSLVPDLNIQGNLTLSRELIELLGLASKPSFDMTGSANLNFKLLGSASSLNWSFSAPLKEIRFTIGDWLVKKTSSDLEVISSGTRAPGRILIAQTQIKTPGFQGLMTGEIGNKNNSFKFDLEEAEIGALANFLPALSRSGLSGSFRGSFVFDEHENGFPINGLIQLISVNYKPEKSPLAFEKVKGRIQINGSSVHSEEIKGYAHGFIEAPVKASIKLAGLENPGTSTGEISLSAGPGKLAADRLTSVLARAEALVQPFLNQNSETKNFNPFELKSATANLQIDSGAVRTDDFRLKASALAMGAIGSVNLKSRQVDILSLIKTSSSPLAAIGNIPLVKDVLQKNEGLLKITGLDKELKRLGIENPNETKRNSSEQSEKPHIVNVIVKIAGLWSEPNLTPVLETALPRDQINRLKELAN